MNNTHFICSHVFVIKFFIKFDSNIFILSYIKYKLIYHVLITVRNINQKTSSKIIAYKI